MSNQIDMDDVFNELDEQGILTLPPRVDRLEAENKNLKEVVNELVGIVEFLTDENEMSDKERELTKTHLETLKEGLEDE